MKLVNLSGPQDVIALLVRRKWWLILPFIGLSAGAVLITSILPQMYVSESVILIRPRDVPSDFVKDLIAGTAAERLSLITEQLLSNGNLERTLKQFQGDIPEFVHLGQQQQIIELRKQIDVQFRAREDIRSGQLPVTAFRISCQNREPQIAQKLCKALVEGFVNQDKENRASNVNETASFFERKVNELGEKRSESDAKLKALKSRRPNELPDQRDSNLRRLESLSTANETLGTNKTNLLIAQGILEQQLSDTPQRIKKDAPPPVKAPTDPDVEDYRKLEDALRALRLSGRMDDYPDVKSLLARRDKLKATLTPEQLEQAQMPAARAATPESAEETLQTNPAYTDLQRRLEISRKQIEEIDRRIARNEEAIRTYDQYVNNTPQGELELTDVLRENEELNRQYQEMSNKYAVIRLSESAEGEQKGANFEVSDWPNLPEIPTKPAKSKIRIAGFALSLLAGLGLAFLVDVATQKTWTQSDITQLLGVKVLAEVPRIPTRKGAANAQRKKLGFVTSVSIAGIAYAFFLYLAYAHPGFVLRQLDPLIQKLY